MLHSCGKLVLKHNEVPTTIVLKRLVTGTNTSYNGTIYTYGKIAMLT